MRLDDQLVTDEAMDTVVGLGARWPEPRALDQVERFHLDDRSVLHLRLLDDEGVADLLRLLELQADALHEVACCDDEQRDGVGPGRARGPARARARPPGCGWSRPSWSAG